MQPRNAYAVAKSRCHGFGECEADDVAAEH